MKKWLASLCFLPALVIAASALNATPLIQHSATPDSSAVPFQLILALEYETSDIQPQRETASLRVPAARDENREGSRCMTVCSNWGEECVMMRAASDVVTKKCVRTCKSFAKECF